MIRMVSDSDEACTAITKSGNSLLDFINVGHHSNHGHLYLKIKMKTLSTAITE